MALLEREHLARFRDTGAGQRADRTGRDGVDADGGTAEINPASVDSGRIERPDTPDKQLFAHDVRAYSHGCMRVQDPAKYAEVLLDIARPNENWTADKIKRMFGTGEQDIQLPAQIW